MLVKTYLYFLNGMQEKIITTPDCPMTANTNIRAMKIAPLTKFCTLQISQIPSTK